MYEGIQDTAYLEASADSWREIDGCVIEESPLTLYINGVEWMTLMCTPVNQDELALGFLVGEGVITSLADVALLEISHRGKVADIWLTHDVTLPRRRVVTSGCVGGTTFMDSSTVTPYLDSGRQATPRQLMALMDQLKRAAQLYPLSRGVHTSALSDGHRLAVVREDVGRHNTLDKLLGASLRQDINTRDMILLTTGRISSEMLRKAANMQVPIVVSRTSPTSMSLELAREWNITVVGYVRRNGLRIYADAAQRISLPDSLISGATMPIPVYLPTMERCFAAD